MMFKKHPSESLSFMSRIIFHFGGGAPIPIIIPLHPLMGFSENCTTKHLSHSYAGTKFSSLYVFPYRLS